MAGAGYKWWVFVNTLMILRGVITLVANVVISGLAEGYPMRRCTVPLDLAFASGFATVYKARNFLTS